MNTYAHIQNLEGSSHNTILTESLDEVSSAISSIITSNTSRDLCTLPPLLSPQQIQHLILAIQCNAHRIVTFTSTTSTSTTNSTPISSYPIGLGLFPYTSMINHSCTPNCAHDFHTLQHGIPTLIMRVLSDIHPGEELTYSYVDLYQSTSIRQTQLYASYGFQCNCSKCNNSMNYNDEYLSNSSSISMKICKQISICISLISTTNTTYDNTSQHNEGKKKGIFKLISILNDTNTTQQLHPLHNCLFQAYACMSVHAYQLICMNSITINEDEKFLLLKVVIGYGALSIASSLYIAKVIMPSSIPIIYTVAFAIKKLHQDFSKLSINDTNIDANINTNINTSNDLTQFLLTILQQIGYCFIKHEVIYSIVHDLSMYIITQQQQQQEEEEVGKIPNQLGKMTTVQVWMLFALREVSIYNVSPDFHRYSKELSEIQSTMIAMNSKL